MNWVDNSGVAQPRFFTHIAAAPSLIQFLWRTTRRVALPATSHEFYPSDRIMFPKEKFWKLFYAL
jgi:hypothetical protein